GDDAGMRIGLDGVEDMSRGECRANTVVVIGDGGGVDEERGGVGCLRRVDDARGTTIAGDLGAGGETGNERRHFIGSFFMGLCAGVAVSVAVIRRANERAVGRARPAVDEPSCLVILAGNMESSLNAVTRGKDIPATC